MSRTKPKMPGARHVRLYHYLLNSAAWQGLDANSRALYVEIAKRYMGANNGRIPYSVREGAAALHISPATVARCLVKLVDHGFIVATMKGAFDYKKRHATEWRLTEFDYGDRCATKDFMRWSPPLNTEPGAPLPMSGSINERTPW
jgi:hypothetical protein